MTQLLSFPLVFLYGIIIGYFLGRYQANKIELPKSKGLDGHRWGEEEL